MYPWGGGYVWWVTVDVQVCVGVGGGGGRGGGGCNVWMNT